MRKSPLVSVIVPVYNGEKYIVECLNSISRQRYKNLEILVINDGSTDCSAERIEECAKQDKRIKIINKTNSGPSASRNTGIELSKGEYICFVDSDDCVSPEYVSYLYWLIKKEGTKASLVLRPINFKSKVIYQKSGKKNEGVWSGEEAARQMMYYHVKESSWLKLINKKLLVENRIRFDEHLICGEGFNFNLDWLQRVDRVAIGQQPIYYYRLDNPSSAMTKFDIDKIRNGLSAIDRIKKKLVCKNGDMLKALRYTYFHTNFDFLMNMVGVKATKKYREDYLSLKSTVRRDALVSLSLPISLKDKVKAILAYCNPYLAAKVINRMRLRKFTVDEQGQ